MLDTDFNKLINDEEKKKVKCRSCGTPLVVNEKKLSENSETTTECPNCHQLTMTMFLKE